MLYFIIQITIKKKYDYFSSDLFTVTAQKMKFFIKGFFSTFDQIPSYFRIWSHLLKESLMENFIFRAMSVQSTVEALINGYSRKHSKSLINRLKFLHQQNVRSHSYIKCPKSQTNFYINTIAILLPSKIFVSQKKCFQLAITYSKLTIETLAQGVKYVQSQQ